MTLTEMETKLLFEMTGYSKEQTPWGAAVSVSLESLKGRGLVACVYRPHAIAYEPTEAGKTKAKEIFDALPIQPSI